MAGRSCRRPRGTGTRWVPPASISGVDGVLRLWRPGAYARPTRLTGHGGPVVKTAQANRDTLVSAGFDSLLRVWSLEKAVCLFVLAGHRGNIADLLMVDGDTCASASHDCTVRLWSVSTGRAAGG